MPFFRKKPVVIEAVKWEGSTASHIAIDMFMKTFPAKSEIKGTSLLIPTLEGTMEASIGGH